MAVKKATTTDDLTEPKSKEPVYAGPAADGPTPTVEPGYNAPDSANLTGSTPDEPSDKPVSMTSPWGSKVTVSSDIAKHFE